MTTTPITLRVAKGLSATVIPDQQHEFIMTTSQVADGYGISQSAIRSCKSNHKDELVLNKHFFTCVQKLDTGKPSVKKTYWTKRGIVRLGFFIKSDRAKHFRDWAEDLIIAAIDDGSVVSQQFVSLVNKAGTISGSHNRLAKSGGFSSAILSLALDPRYTHKVSSEMKNRIKAHCNYIIGLSSLSLHPLLEEILLKHPARKMRDSMLEVYANRKTSRTISKELFSTL